MTASDPNMVAAYGCPPLDMSPRIPTDGAPFWQIPVPVPPVYPGILPSPGCPPYNPSDPNSQITGNVTDVNIYTPRELAFMEEITRLRVEVSRLKAAVHALTGA